MNRRNMLKTIIGGVILGPAAASTGNPLRDFHARNMAASRPRLLIAAPGKIDILAAGISRRKLSPEESRATYGPMVFPNVVEWSKKK